MLTKIFLRLIYQLPVIYQPLRRKDASINKLKIHLSKDPQSILPTYKESIFERSFTRNSLPHDPRIVFMRHIYYVCADVNFPKENLTKELVKEHKMIHLTL